MKNYWCHSYQESVLPCSQEAQTNFATVVQVRVKPNGTVPCGNQPHLWRNRRVCHWYEDIEYEAPTTIRAIFRFREHQQLHQIRLRYRYTAQYANIIRQSIFHRCEFHFQLTIPLRCQMRCDAHLIEKRVLLKRLFQQNNFTSIWWKALINCTTR